MSYELIEVAGQDITEPVSLDFQKAWSRIDQDYSAEDAVLQTQITAARELLEQYLNIALVRRDFKLTWNGGLMELPLSKNAVVGSVLNGTDVVDYTVTNGFISIGDSALNYDYFYNLTKQVLEVTQLVSNEPEKKYTATYTTGYDTLPTALKQAIATQADWFINKNIGLCAAAASIAEPFSRNLVL